MPPLRMIRIRNMHDCCFPLIILASIPAPYEAEACRNYYALSLIDTLPLLRLATETEAFSRPPCTGMVSVVAKLEDGIPSSRLRPHVDGTRLAAADA